MLVGICKLYLVALLINAIKSTMATKTPVSILQELAVHQGCNPQYELVLDGVGTHNPEFEYVVVMRDISARGRGRSKKEAKHNAADAALKELSKADDVSVKTSAKTPIEEITAGVSQVLSPYSNQMQDNAIGELQDLCNTHQLTTPVYDMIHEEGPPHEKQFTFQCTVAKQKERGVARTKKQAKQICAHKMLQRLRSSLEGVINFPSTQNIGESKQKLQNFDEAVRQYSRLKNTSNVPLDKKVSQCHLLMKDLKSDKLEMMKNELIDQLEDPLAYLEDVAAQLGTTADYQEIPSASKGKYIYLATVATSPTVTTLGSAGTAEEAKKDAARDALKHLCVMTQ